MKKIKVLYIDTPIEPPGGGQKSLLLLLKKMDCQKKVFIPGESSFCMELNKEKIDYEVVNIKNLFSRIKAYSPDIVHCNAPTVRYSFIAALSAKMLSIPFIWHLRVADKAFLKDDIIAILSDRIIAISKYVKNKLNRLWHKKTYVIYNAVDIENIKIKEDAVSLKEKLNIDSSHKIIGVFSRFVRWKGHALFLESAFRLLNKRKDLKFILAGSGELKGQIENMVLKSSFKDNFIFTGNLEEPLDYMNICDIVVHPSLKGEGFGRSIIEAMSIGRVVLATYSGGPSEIIDNGVDGFLVSSDVISLYKKIEFILNLDKGRLKEISERARLKVGEMFSAERQTTEISRIYGELINEKNSD